MITLRLTSSSLAGTTRKLVAVGTPRLASMFDTITAPAPRIGSPTSPAAPAAGAGAAAGAAAAGSGVGAGAGAGAGVGATMTAPGR